MSKVKIEGHGTGTGTFTVTTPSSNTDRTITLPDSTDTLAVNSDVTNKLPLAGGTLTGDLTLNGADIVKSGSADLTIDSGGRIDLSADDNGEIRLWDGSSKYAQFKDDDDRLKIQSIIQDKDIMFVGNDGGVETTALKLDMSEGGLAICYGGVAIGGTDAAHTLDDYEEGTWTATYGGSTNTGNYRKVGNIVSINVILNTTASAFSEITGFPFTSTGRNPMSTGRGNGTSPNINTLGFEISGVTMYINTGTGAAASLTTGGTVRIDIGGTYLTS